VIVLIAIKHRIISFDHVVNAVFPFIFALSWHFSVFPFKFALSWHFSVFPFIFAFFLLNLHCRGILAFLRKTLKCHDNANLKGKTQI
jgi:hypothetical protein